jgi:putative hydroxymethylpyrimidine transport system substrate-binding protein
MRRAAAALAALLLLAGCGSDDGPAVRLALDFTPNAVHAPVFAAAGPALEVVPPGAQPDSVGTLLAGRADLGLLDIHDLAIARERGEDLVAIGALVGRPLAALLAQPGIRRPRDLEGERVGVSGLPSDPAFVNAMVRADGGDPSRVRFTTIGFQAVSALLGERVAAVPAFWNAEGVALRERGKAITELRVERYGAPPYPEVVLVTTRERLRERREALRGALRAIADGIEEVREDPAAAAARIAEEAGEADPRLVRAQLDAVAPLFADGLRLDRPVLERWAAYDAEIGIVERPPDVARAFAFDLAP